jgi:hypothetical protein
VTAPTAAPQGGVAAQPVAIQCNPVAGLPVIDGATCVETDTDTDNGVIKLENTYTTAASADEVRRFYEGAFGQNGWTLSDFSYAINLDQRQLKIDVETEQGVGGAFTQVRLTERRPAGAGAPAAVTCAPIEGLPAFTNAACAKVETDLDDGVAEIENTYSTTASPADVLSFYAQTLAQNGWASQDTALDIRQGLRGIQIDIEAQPGPQGSFTRLKITEK